MRRSTWTDIATIVTNSNLCVLVSQSHAEDASTGSRRSTVITGAKAAIWLLAVIDALYCSSVLSYKLWKVGWSNGAEAKRNGLGSRLVAILRGAFYVSVSAMVSLQQRQWLSKVLEELIGVLPNVSMRRYFLQFCASQIPFGILVSAASSKSGESFWSSSGCGQINSVNSTLFFGPLVRRPNYALQSVRAPLAYPSLTTWRTIPLAEWDILVEMCNDPGVPSGDLAQ